MEGLLESFNVNIVFLFQGFYLYLYLVSLMFVVFQYVNIMRQKAVNLIIHDYGKSFLFLFNKHNTFLDNKISQHA